MGNTSHDRVTRRTQIVSPASSLQRLEEFQRNAVNADDPLILPLEGTNEANSATYLVELAIDTPLVLQITGNTISVFHLGVYLGYLGGNATAVFHQLIEGHMVSCTLRSTGGGQGEFCPTVCIWL